jgi:hypothetical protein
VRALQGSTETVNNTSRNAAQPATTTPLSDNERRDDSSDNSVR